MNTKKILDVATERYQDIITAVNKGDLEAVKALCLTSIFGEESDFCDILTNDKDNQVTAMKVLCRDNCKSYDWLRPLLAGFRLYLETEGHDILHYWSNNKDVMTEVFSYMANMCSDWFSDEPRCILSDAAFQMYRLLKQIDLAVIWHKFLEPLTEYMEDEKCAITSATEKDGILYIVNAFLEDL